MRSSLSLALTAVIVPLASAIAPGCGPGAGKPAEVGNVWAVEETDAPANAAVQKKLRQTLPRLEFSGIPLSDVIQFMRDVSTSSIFVKWGALTAVGIDKTTPVNIKLTNVTFEKALRTILTDVGGVTQLGYVVNEGVITISTMDDLSTHVVTRVYEVSDLIQIGALTPEEKADLRALLREELQAPVPAPEPKPGDGEPLAQAYAGKVDMLAEEVVEAILRRQANALLRVIQDTVRPETWRSSGGTTGMMFIFGDKLVVTNTRHAHEHIALLLAALRGQTALVKPIAPPAKAPTTQPGLGTQAQPKS